MRAWLVTWDWIGDHAKVADPLIAIFSARKSDSQIANYVEQYYLMASCTARGVVYFISHPRETPYRAKISDFINSIPHGDRVRCGPNPWIYARIVTDLRVTLDQEHRREIISWKEPPTFRWKDDLRLGEIEVAREGRLNSLRRIIGPILKVDQTTG